MFDFDGQVVMVTGAASGFGERAATRLAGLGARLVLGDRNEEGLAQVAPYAAAKHAVVGLTKTAALEYARRNIRVNAICPYYALPPMVAGSDLNQRLDFLAQGSPMKRLGETDEIVSVMLMLCARENSYLNGQAVAVDGGLSAF